MIPRAPGSKSQSALEYMMTYGWAILIIVIVAGVLYSLGIFSPSSSAGTTVTGFSGLGSPTALCMANGGLRLQLGDNLGMTINITGINVTVNGAISTTRPNQTISPQGTYIFYVPNVCGTSSGARYSFTSTVTYTEPGQTFAGPYFSSGAVSGVVSSIMVPGFAGYINGFQHYKWSWCGGCDAWIFYPLSYMSANVIGMAGTNNSFTIIMWVYLVQKDYTAVPPPNSSTDYTAQQLILGSFNNSQAIASIGPSDIFLHRCGTDINIYTNTPEILPNQWNFIAISVQKPNYYIQLNDLGGSASDVGGYSTTNTFFIGYNAFCFGGWPLDGYISNVQLFNISLTPSQLNQTYEEGMIGKPVINSASLVAWWPFNQSSGNSVKDYSGHGFSGILTNSTITSNYP